MKKKNHEHTNLERWLVSYADFITLLFAFFVVMYALSMQNLSKVKAAAESIRKAFGGPAVVSGAGGDLRGETRVDPFDPPAAAGEPTGELRKMKGELEEAASLETGSADFSERMQTLFDGRGLVVRLSAKDFFGRFETAVRPDFQPLLDRIGRVIARTRRPIRIEGYSDPGEADHPPGFSSGWELSAARAAWVAKYWIARFALDPARIGVVGYAHYRPLTSDAKSSGSEWEQGGNRRIEIVILDQ